MSGGRITRLSARAVIGVLALYCVLLQSFLAGAIPLPPDLGRGIICIVHPDGEQGGGKAVPHDHQCCVAAQIQALTEPPEAGSVLVPAPSIAPRLVRRPEAEIPRTGPPPTANSPRGPPAA